MCSQPDLHAHSCVRVSVHTAVLIFVTVLWCYRTVGAPGRSAPKQQQHYLRIPQQLIRFHQHCSLLNKQKVGAYPTRGWIKG